LEGILREPVSVPFHIEIVIVIVLGLIALYCHRFVDRDMTMHYHWGLGVGHAYSHADAPSKPGVNSSHSKYSLFFATGSDDFLVNLTAQDKEPEIQTACMGKLKRFGQRSLPRVNKALILPHNIILDCFDLFMTIVFSYHKTQ
jgi:hypothetical protein